MRFPLTMSHQLSLFAKEKKESPPSQTVPQNTPPAPSLHLQSVFYELEMPLIPILMHMESRGFLIDKEYLGQLKDEVTQSLNELTECIYTEAGSTFNINSGKQLSKILFEHLGLKPVRRTKTGYSTDAKTLDKLQNQHPIVPLLLEYRHLDKLLNTYITPFPLLINTQTGRVHTSYNQAVTTTGRLSSSKPNLQNIPIRTSLGQKIRKAFIAQEGYALVAFDYSQIELRLMAHLAQDKNMLEDFAQGKDIHTTTAQRIFKVQQLEDVTKEQRGIAKAINFGAIYGAGARTIAQNAHVPTTEAKQFLEDYFTQYHAVRDYMEYLKEEARKTGYASTLFGRVLMLPDINSGHPQMKAAAERIAINMPLQGTAADIMKKAMIAVHDFVIQHTPDLWIILQVHDELVLEIKEEMVHKYRPTIQNLMQDVVSLDVPLKVNVQVGKNWGEMQKI